MAWWSTAAPTWSGWPPDGGLGRACWRRGRRRGTIGGGARVEVSAHSLTLAPLSRTAVNLNDMMASAVVTVPVNVSTRVDASQPVNAERAVCFSADPGLGAVAEGATIGDGR